MELTSLNNKQPGDRKGEPNRTNRTAANRTPVPSKSCEPNRTASSLRHWQKKTACHVRSRFVGLHFVRDWLGAGSGGLWFAAGSRSLGRAPQPLGGAQISKNSGSMSASHSVLAAASRSNLFSSPCPHIDRLVVNDCELAWLHRAAQAQASGLVGRVPSAEEVKARSSSTARSRVNVQGGNPHGAMRRTAAALVHVAPVIVWSRPAAQVFLVRFLVDLGCACRAFLLE